jgi:hypothetical protein
MFFKVNKGITWLYNIGDYLLTFWNEVKLASCMENIAVMKLKTRKQPPNKTSIVWYYFMTTHKIHISITKWTQP